MSARHWPSSLALGETPRWEARWHLRSRPFCDFVVFVVDPELCASSKAYPAFRIVRGWKPELSDLFVTVADPAFLDPEGRVLGRLGFDTRNHEFLCINPNLTAIEKLIVPFGHNVQYILGVLWSSFCPD